MTLFVLLSVLSTLLSNLQDKTLQAEFSLSMQEQGQAAITAPGKVTMHGTCFVGNSRGYEVAYDGTTFYLYDPDSKELTLSHPIKEELLTCNPLLYIQAVSQVSNIKETVNKDGTITTITMVPKGTPDDQMRVTIKVKADMVQSVEIKEGKRTTTLRLKNPVYISSQPEYVVTKPGAYVNDLR